MLGRTLLLPRVKASLRGSSNRPRTVFAHQPWKLPHKGLQASGFSQAGLHWTLIPSCMCIGWNVLKYAEPDISNIYLTILSTQCYHFCLLGRDPEMRSQAGAEHTHLTLLLRHLPSSLSPGNAQQAISGNHRVYLTPQSRRPCPLSAELPSLF